jgi:two-component system response regulator CpxR
VVRSQLRFIQAAPPGSADLFRGPGTNSLLESLRLNGISFDPAARRFTVNARELPLTTMEYDILASLVSAAGRVVSRDALMTAVFGRDASPLDRALDVHISHLRRKLGPYRHLILTVRSVGYMFRAPVNKS